MLRRHIENFLTERSDSKRTIVNLLRGRKKALVEDLNDISELVELLGSLEDSVKISLRFRDGRYRRSILKEGGLSPQKVIEFIKEKFREDLGTHHYMDIQHEVFTGRGNERHYFNIDQGWIKGPEQGPYREKAMPSLAATVYYTTKRTQ